MEEEMHEGETGRRGVDEVVYEIEMSEEDG